MRANVHTTTVRLVAIASVTLKTTSQLSSGAGRAMSGNRSPRNRYRYPKQKESDDATVHEYDHRTGHNLLRGDGSTTGDDRPRRRKTAHRQKPDDEFLDAEKTGVLAKYPSRNCQFG